MRGEREGGGRRVSCLAETEYTHMLCTPSPYPPDSSLQKRTKRAPFKMYGRSVFVNSCYGKNGPGVHFLLLLALSVSLSKPLFCSFCLSFSCSYSSVFFLFSHPNPHLGGRSGHASPQPSSHSSETLNSEPHILNPVPALPTFPHSSPAEAFSLENETLSQCTDEIKKMEKRRKHHCRILHGNNNDYIFAMEKRFARLGGDRRTTHRGSKGRIRTTHRGRKGRTRTNHRWVGKDQPQVGGWERGRENVRLSRL